MNKAYLNKCMINSGLYGKFSALAKSHTSGLKDSKVGARLALATLQQIYPTVFSISPQFAQKIGAVPIRKANRKFLTLCKAH